MRHNIGHKADQDLCKGVEFECSRLHGLAPEKVVWNSGSSTASGAQQGGRAGDPTKIPTPQGGLGTHWSGAVMERDEVLWIVMIIYISYSLAQKAFIICNSFK